MSAVLAVIGPAGLLPDDDTLHAMLDGMRLRGTEVRRLMRQEGGVFAAGRYRWELGLDFSGETLVASDEERVVVADASLYYRMELECKLRSAGAVPRSRDPGELILAAYRAWGDDALAELEGDFSFVLWDRARGKVLAARDFVGTRPLFYATVGPTLVVASGIGAVLAMPGVPADLNLPALAQTTSMVLLPQHETSYRAVRALPAGHALLRDARSSTPSVRRFWEIPRFAGEDQPAVGFEEAAEELNRLLVAATAERFGIESRTAVTLSGGWDSPAVYAAAHAGLRREGRSSGDLLPVSISFPEGDSGREDEMISTITAHFGQAPRWLPIGEIPLIAADFEARAAAADDPFVHVFAEFNRSMARAAAAEGARTILNGGGGDHLFHADPAYLSDLLRRGHLLRFAKEWRAERLSGLAAIRDWVVRPLLGPPARRMIGRLRGGDGPAGYLDRSLPPWIDARFAEEAGLEEYARGDVPQRRGDERAEGFERRWMLEHPMYPRVMSAVHAISLEQGLDQRSPLLDARIVRFAATRPRAERRSGRETKRLLRASVSGLLPAEVLRPREVRTGTTSSYFQRSMMSNFATCGIKWLKDPVLAEIGVVNRDALYRACAAAERGRIEEHSAALVIALHAEIWLRATLGRETRPMDTAERPYSRRANTRQSRSKQEV